MCVVQHSHLKLINVIYVKYVCFLNLNDFADLYSVGHSVMLLSFNFLSMFKLFIDSLIKFPDVQITKTTNKHSRESHLSKELCSRAHSEKQSYVGNILGGDGK